MRSIPIGLLLLAVFSAGGLAQQPGHPREHPVSRDTSMSGMPGMKKRPGPPKDTTSAEHGAPKHGRGEGRDTGTRGMGQRPARPDSAMPGMAGMPPGKSGTMGMDMTGPLGIADSREASGTAWQPDVSPMYALHRSAGQWSLMFHGNAFLQSIHEGSQRGEQQLGSVNWFMGMARRSMAGGDLTLRGMLSLEPITVGKCGYPDLLATGESCNGQPLHDRQHPHDLFMEVAAQYRRAITRSLAVDVYGGPAGEPALGPVAYPHRVSALWSPIAPISHHWQDATHIAFGVVTAGLYGRVWKLEGSAFNGREPDDARFNFDLGALDSYSARLWILPSDRLALQISNGYLRAAETTAGGGRVDVHRSTASLSYNAPVRAAGLWANTIVWGQNRAHGQVTSAGLVETSLDLDGRNVIFGRGELDQKSGDDLALDQQAPGLADRVFNVGKLAVGYTRQFSAGALRPGLGAELSLNFVPAGLKPYYGSTASAGLAVFASVHPGPMRVQAEEAMIRAPEATVGGGGSLSAPPD